MAALANIIPEETQRRALDILARWHIPHEFMTELIDHGATAAFARGETIFRRGSTADMGYWIVSGLAKVFFPLLDGSRIIVGLAGPGEFVGVMHSQGASGRHVQVFEVQAMTRVSVAIFSRDRVLAMLKAMNPAGLVALLENVNTTWSEVFSRCVEFLGLPFSDRLRWVFQHLASRYGVRDARGILLTPELSQEDLAEMIASSRPMISRLTAEFIERGEIVRQGKHYILLNTNIAQPLQAELMMPKAKRLTARTALQSLSAVKQVRRRVIDRLTRG